MQPTPISRRAFLQSLALQSEHSPSDSDTAPSRVSLVEPLTPIADFYRQQLYGTPQLTAESWLLTVGGQVTDRLSLTYDDLVALPAVEIPATLLCAGSHPNHPLIGTARWHGTPLMALLESLGARGDHIHFIAADGYSTSLHRAQLDDAILAYRMNGEPLPAAHGFPARLITTGVYGYKLPKWIRRIEIADNPLPGYWEMRGWPADGEPSAMAAIFHPCTLEALRGEITLAGIAFAGRRALEYVEISIDDGDWLPIPLKPYAAGCWSLWQTRWTPPAPGRYIARVRAVDEAGRRQPPNAPTAFPGGILDYPSTVLHISA